jgi:hypothetical protein
MRAIASPEAATKPLGTAGRVAAELGDGAPRSVMSSAPTAKIAYNAMRGGRTTAAAFISILPELANWRVDASNTRQSLLPRVVTASKLF